MGTLQSNRSKARFLPSPFSLLPLALLFVLCLSCENPASDNEEENNDTDFVAVAGISGLPQSVSVGTEIDLGSAVVTPQNATNSDIVWSVKEDDTTGVTDADLAGGAFTPLSAGTLTLTATVADGSGADADFTRDFTIIITLWREVEGYAGGGGHVVFGAGKFISCSYIDGSAAYSADGEHWMPISKVATTFGDDYIKNLAFIENTFWAVGKGGKIAKSSNGTDWTAVTHDGVATTATFYGIAYSGTKYIIAGEGATDNAPGRMIASVDGVTWTDITPASNPFTAKIDSIAYGEGKFLAVGNGGKAAISQDDGETWTDVTAPMFSGNHIKMAAFGGGKFVAVSRYGLGTTTDGADWAWSELWSFTQNPASQDVKVWIQAVIWDGASFYIGAQGGRVAYSATGAPESWHYAVDGTNKDTAGVFHNMNDYINGIACGAIDGKKIYVATGGDGAPKAAIAISNEE
jgi:hypothetical protein